MSKPKSQPVPEANPQEEREECSPGRHGGQEPLSGSKKVKNRNHVSHNNPQG